MGLHFIKNGTKHDVCVKRPSLFPASATTYDNTNHPELPNRAQGAIDGVADKVTANIFGNEVTITADYTFPEDGYMQVYVVPGQYISCDLCGSNDSDGGFVIVINQTASPDYGVSVTYVKKGMVVKPSHIGTNCYLRFRSVT